MLFVVLDWLVIFFTAYPVGFFLLKRFECGKLLRENKIGICTAAGLVFATAYAQIFSLFDGASLGAFLGILGMAAFCALTDRGACFVTLAAGLRDKKIYEYAVLAFAGLMVIYATAVGWYLPDTAMYHAQSVRWIEEYGVVRGLGNIIRNLAYNSSLFSVTALYSMKYVFGQSMHTIQGFWAMLVLTQCTGMIGHIWSRDIRLSDLARVAAIYYASLNNKEMISPSSDLGTMFPIFLVFIWWLELLEERETEPCPFIVLCMIACNCVTTKLSAGLLLLLCIKPIGMLVIRRRWKMLFASIGTALAIIGPYLIRNVIISGWLLYPATFPDLFSVPWKMPAEIGRADSYQIHVWGWDVHADSVLGAAPLWTWIPHWFNTVLWSFQKVLVATSFAGCIATFIAAAVMGIRALIGRDHRQEKEVLDPDLLLVLLTLSVSYLFWQYSAPLPRYGYAYILLLPVLWFGILARILVHSLEKYGRYAILKWGMRMGAVLAALFLCYRAWTVLDFVLGTYPAVDLVYQMDYPNGDRSDEQHDLRRFVINGITFYEDNNSGYHPLPVANINFDMLGEKIEDGFYYEPHSEASIQWAE